MTRFASRVLPAALAIVTAVALAPPASAATTPKSFADCMNIAVGEHDANPWIAHDACDAAELTTCYRILRDAYGPQSWILEACKARTD